MSVPGENLACCCTEEQACKQQEGGGEYGGMADQGFEFGEKSCVCFIFSRHFFGGCQAGKCDCHQHHGGKNISATPADIIAGNQNEARSQHASAVKTDPETIGEAIFPAIEKFNGVAVNGDIIGGGKGRKNANGNPHPGAKFSVNSEQAHDCRHDNIGCEHPAPVMAVMVNCRCPQKFN